MLQHPDGSGRSLVRVTGRTKSTHSTLGLGLGLGSGLTLTPSLGLGSGPTLAPNQVRVTRCAGQVDRLQAEDTPTPTPTSHPNPNPNQVRVTGRTKSVHSTWRKLQRDDGSIEVGLGLGLELGLEQVLD